MPVAIRPAGAGDLDQILAIEARWPTTPKWTRGQFERELASERSRLMAAAEDGVVLAYAMAALLPPEAEVLDVAVLPERARQGLGRLLLESLHEAARGAGCGVVHLEVSERNEAALRLYGRLGYRETGRRRAYYPDGSAAVLMTVRL